MATTIVQRPTKMLSKLAFLHTKATIPNIALPMEKKIMSLGLSSKCGVVTKVVKFGLSKRLRSKLTSATTFDKTKLPFTQKIKPLKLKGGFSTEVRFTSIARLGIKPSSLNSQSIIPVGNGAISGTVYEGKSPVIRRVRLYKKDDGVFVSETLSNVLGGYRFDSLPRGMAFFVVSHDSNGVYNAVISDNVIAQ